MGIAILKMFIMGDIIGPDKEILFASNFELFS